MSSSRKIFLVSAFLLVCHFLVLALHFRIASSLIEFVLVALAAVACFQAGGRVGGYAHRFWRLMGTAFVIYAVGQAFVIYYDGVLHAPLTVWWPSDVLLLFHVVPIAMGLFLGENESSLDPYRWQQWLDFLQVGIVYFSAYWFFLYFTLNTPELRQSAEILGWHFENWRNALLTGAFVLRAAVTNSRLVRSLYGRMSVYLLLYSLGDGIYVYAQNWWHVPSGTADELLWTIPRVCLVWMVTTWRHPAEADPAPSSSLLESLLLAQFSHIAFPLLVLAMAATARGRQLKIAVATVVASFSCSSARLFLGQRAQKELLEQQELSAEALRAAEAKFRGLLESAPDPVVVVNKEGNIVLINAEAERAFGYARANLFGKTMEILMPERLRQKCAELRTAFFREPQRCSLGAGLEIYGLRKDGREFPVEVNLSLLETTEGLWGSAAIRDLTERRKLETQFRQAQKMESIGTLAGGIAHDFNNLLTVILSYSGSLSEELPRNSKQQRAAEQIHQAAERGASLTRQMLAFSRRQVFQMRVVNLNKVIRDLLKMLQRIIGEHIEIKAVLADDLKTVNADPGQLEQVLMNLCVNARDAMPKGGKLTLETQNVVLEEDFVSEHMGSKPGRHVLLTVSDTGVGIDKAVLSRVFDPFFTTKAPGQGTGLGLAMVYGVVKQSGGSIWVYSELGQGTSFKIYLPQAGDASEVTAARPAATAVTPGSETILLVEDDPAVRELVQAILAAQGYTVLAADQPRDVESICQRHPGNLHLLLTDMILPGVTGREIAKRVAALRPEVKVLYMSGYTDDALIQSHGLDGTFAFLQKPFSRTSLGTKVREVLDADGPVRGSSRRGV